MPARNDLEPWQEDDWSRWLAANEFLEKIQRARETMAFVLRKRPYMPTYEEAARKAKTFQDYKIIRAANAEIFGQPWNLQGYSQTPFGTEFVIDRVPALEPPPWLRERTGPWYGLWQSLYDLWKSGAWRK